MAFGQQDFLKINISNVHRNENILMVNLAKIFWRIKYFEKTHKKYLDCPNQGIHNS